MKYFLDNEFLEDGNTIELISIGVVCEDGRQYYAINEEAPWSRIVNNDWLRTNVVPHLPIVATRLTENGLYRADIHESPHWKCRREIAADLNSFVNNPVDGQNEFWAYYGDYDWVATCRLWGRMIDLPGHFPKFCYDLRQWLNHKGLPHVRQPDDAPHNALEDAKWVAHCHKANAPQGDSPDHEWEGRYKKLFREFNETEHRLQERINTLETIIDAEDLRPDS